MNFKRVLSVSLLRVSWESGHCSDFLEPWFQLNYFWVVLLGHLFLLSLAVTNALGIQTIDLFLDIAQTEHRATCVVTGTSSESLKIILQGRMLWIGSGYVINWSRTVCRRWVLLHTGPASIRGENGMVWMVTDTHIWSDPFPPTCYKVDKGEGSWGKYHGWIKNHTASGSDSRYGSKGMVNVRVKTLHLQLLVSPKLNKRR